MKPPTKLKLKKKNPLAKPSLDHRKVLMVKYLSAGFSIQEVADKLQVSRKRCKNWLKKKDVKRLLEREMDKVVNIDSIKRKKKYGVVFESIYEQLIQKIADGKLEKLGTKNLMKFLMDFGKEMREDSPEESNNGKGTTNVNILLTEDIQQRYKKANSITYGDRTDKIIDMEMPPNNIDAPLPPAKKEEIIDVDTGEQKVQNFSQQTHE